MSAILLPRTKIVIDAGIAVWAVLPILSSLNVLDTISQWRRSNIEIYAPSLWWAETTSAIRRAVSTNLITSESGKIAIEDVIALEIEVIATTPSHCRLAFAWAERLGQSKAYDGFYLALADELGALFYTTDQRMVSGAQQKGISWVKWVGHE